MSGICGMWRKDGPERLGQALARVAAALRRSPSDASRTELCEGGGACMIARFRSQQLWRGGRVVVACDADLSNVSELADSAGYRPEETPDGTAALMARLYERHGCDFVGKLRGAFSVIVWDAAAERLMAAVDDFGIKRLAYAESGGVVGVASRVDALAAAGDFDTAVNPKAIANVLNFSANLGPETIFRSVRRLGPGAALVFSRKGARAEKFWDMRYGAGANESEKQLAAELESTVENAVALLCRNTAPAETGAFLSGGTDSSTVVGLMTRRQGAPVKSFSIGFEEQPFNELGYAAIAAKRFGSEHHTYLVSARDCFEALPDMVRSFDEPFGNSSAIPTYFCARLAAANGVKTLLAGDGGDELFGGNERYATDAIFELYKKIPRPLRSGLIEPVAAVLPDLGPARRARGYIRRANMPGIERMLSFQFLWSHAPSDVFTPDFLDALGGYWVGEIPAKHYADADARDHLDRLLYVDVKITLADNDLPKVTCMSELAGIEPRFPFLDRSVAEFSGRVPARWKVKGLEKRYLFKRAFGRLLPEEIIRKKKHGFGIPVAAWMRSDRSLRELLHDTLRSPRALERGYFRRDFIDDLLRKHDAEDSTGYYGDTLWTLLTMELWHREMLDEKLRVSACLS